MLSWKAKGRESVGMDRVLRGWVMSDAPLKPDELERYLRLAWSDREDVTWRYRDSKKRGLIGIRPLKNLHPDRDPRLLPSYLSNHSAPFRYILGIPRRRIIPEFQPSAISISLNLLPASALCPNKNHIAHCNPQLNYEYSKTGTTPWRSSASHSHGVLTEKDILGIATARVNHNYHLHSYVAVFVSYVFSHVFYYRGVAYLFYTSTLLAYRR